MTKKTPPIPEPDDSWSDEWTDFLRQADPVRVGLKSEGLDPNEPDAGMEDFIQRVKTRLVLTHADPVPVKPDLIANVQDRITSVNPADTPGKGAGFPWKYVVVGVIAGVILGIGAYWGYRYALNGTATGDTPATLQPTIPNSPPLDSNHGPDPLVPMEPALAIDSQSTQTGRVMQGRGTSKDSGRTQQGTGPYRHVPVTPGASKEPNEWN